MLCPCAQSHSTREPLCSLLTLYVSPRHTQEPEYKWRGLMIDSGRRFFPMPLVKNLMDTMAANKMNVLHLHASDHCRFGVESKNYPKLHTALTGIHKGYYTQEDVKDMIAYGKKNGALRSPQTRRSRVGAVIRHLSM